jgi:hypothetical protein
VIDARDAIDAAMMEFSIHRKVPVIFEAGDDGDVPQRPILG